MMYMKNLAVCALPNHSYGYWPLFFFFTWFTWWKWVNFLKQVRLLDIPWFTTKEPQVLQRVGQQCKHRHHPTDTYSRTDHGREEHRQQGEAVLWEDSLGRILRQSLHLALVGLELTEIILSLPPKYWDETHESQHTWLVEPFKEGSSSEEHRIGNSLGELERASREMALLGLLRYLRHLAFGFNFLSL